MGVDRAYVALAETPVRVYAWSVDGPPYPSGWPEAATLPEQIEDVGLGIVAVRNVRFLPPGAAKTTLMTFGVQGWACVSLLMPGRSRGILGFDTFRPARGVFFPRPAVRLAGECERQVDESDYSLPLALALKAAATAIASCERKGYPVSAVEP